MDDTNNIASVGNTPKTVTKGKTTVVVAMGIIIAVLAVMVLGLIGYIISEKRHDSAGDEFTNASAGTASEDTGESVVNNVAGTANNGAGESNATLPIAFDGAKSLNTELPIIDPDGNAHYYDLALYDSSGIQITFGEAAPTNTILIRFQPTELKEFYGWFGLEIQEDLEYRSERIEFSKNVADVFIGHMGQSPSSDTIFILLEDGTVEYIPIIYAFSRIDEGGLKSYGKLVGVSGVVKFMPAGTWGGRDVLAIRNDGSFYVLYTALIDSGAEEYI